MTKAEAQRRHAKRRAKERIGINLDDEFYDELVLMIQRGKAEFAGRDSKAFSKWRFYFNSKPYIAVYDKKRKTIVTFLPPYQLDTFHYVTF
jgi:hypothetical protein